MKSIVFIVPYFGKFPSYFQLWLNSCKLNPTIEWLIITDISEHYDYPQNVKIISMTFKELKIYIQTKYDFPINLNAPYKLCDFRPAYGEIFQEFIASYDYWGHCDVDLIWGNIRKFLTDDLLNEEYDKIFNWGHCTLYRNTEENNRTYRTKVGNIPDYRTILTSSFNWISDEEQIVEIYHQLKKKVCDELFCFDIRVKKQRFQPSLETVIGTKHEYLLTKTGVFSKTRNGIFFCYYENKDVKKIEFMYVHIQKRNMEVKLPLPFPDSYNIVPNKFVSAIELTRKSIKAAQPIFPINWQYVRWYWKWTMDVLFDRPRVVLVHARKERWVAKLFHRKQYFIKY